MIHPGARPHGGWQDKPSSENRSVAATLGAHELGKDCDSDRATTRFPEPRRAGAVGCRATVTASERHRVAAWPFLAAADGRRRAQEAAQEILGEIRPSRHGSQHACRDRTDDEIVLAAAKKAATSRPSRRPCEPPRAAPPPCRATTKCWRPIPGPPRRSLADESPRAM